MDKQTTFYPASSFPGVGQQNMEWDITGTLVPGTPMQSTIIPNRKEEVPEAEPADAPQGNFATVLPVATPTSGGVSGSSSSMNSDPSMLGNNTYQSAGPGGINSISEDKAIQLDAQRHENHPSTLAMTTDTPANALPATQDTIPAPNIPSDYQTTMSSSGIPTTVKTMDTITDPSAVKTG